MLSATTRDDLIRRLRKIEGQTQGIQRMIADERECRDILNQLASVRAATERVSRVLMESYIQGCLHDPHCLTSEQTVGDLVDFLLRVGPG